MSYVAIALVVIFAFVLLFSVIKIVPQGGNSRSNASAATPRPSSPALAS
jgi:hypothetical protein